MKGLPHAERNLEAEEAILGAVAIILVWQPPPAWERSRTRFDAHIIAAARTLMDKAFLPTEPSWHWPQKHYPKRLPRSGAREGGDASVQRLSVFGNSSVKVSVFRRAKERGRGGAAGSEGGARLRRKRGAVKRVWFIPACIFRCVAAWMPYARCAVAVVVVAVVVAVAVSLVVAAAIFLPRQPFLCFQYFFVD